MYFLNHVFINFCSILASILGPIFLQNRLKYDKVVRHHHVFFHLRFLSPLWGTPWLLNPPCTPPAPPPHLEKIPTSSFKDFLPLRGCFGCRSASLCPSSLLVRFLVSLVPFAFLRFLATAWSSASLSVRSFLCLPSCFFCFVKSLKIPRAT